MQIGHDMLASASNALNSKPSSLRQFGRFGAVVVGAVSGIVAVSSQAGARESAFKAAIAERDQEIAQLKSAKKSLEMEKSGITAKASSGDPVQDWIDSLAE